MAISVQLGTVFYSQTCCAVLSCVQLFLTPWTVAHQLPLSTGFSRQEYWSGLLCPPPGGLPDAGIKPVPPVALALQVDSLWLSHQRSTSCANNNSDFVHFNLANLSETFYLVVPLTFLKCFLHFASKPLNHPVFPPASLTPSQSSHQLLVSPAWNHCVSKI